MSKKKAPLFTDKGYVATAAILVIAPALSLYSPLAITFGSGVELIVFYATYATLSIVAGVIGIKVLRMRTSLSVRILAILILLMAIFALGFNCFFLVLANQSIPF